MRLLMGLKYQEQITETLMQSIAELEDSVEWQKIFRKGEAKGQAIGEAKGKAIGKAEGERSVLIRLATARFGAPSAAILRKLESISDEQQLQDIALRILHAASWDELLH